MPWVPLQCSPAATFSDACQLVQFSLWHTSLSPLFFMKFMNLIFRCPWPHVEPTALRYSLNCSHQRSLCEHMCISSISRSLPYQLYWQKHFVDLLLQVKTDIFTCMPELAPNTEDKQTTYLLLKNQISSKCARKPAFQQPIQKLRTYTFPASYTSIFVH